jgi:hypothetical protein
MLLSRSSVGAAVALLQKNMPTDRLPCTKCSTMILPATAAAYGGLCGQCARKAQEAADFERQLQKKKEKAARPITYDIDAILASEDFMSDLDGALPDPDDPRYPKLTAVERHLKSLAEFERRCGGGFSTLIDNRYFELLSMTLRAARKIGKSILLDGLIDLERTLLGYGFPRWLIRSRDGFYASLSESQHADLERDLQALDHKYFTYDADSIWSVPDFRTNTREYVMKHATDLRKRRA